jgi:hypothetical protein
MKNLPVKSSRRAARRREEAPLEVEPVRERGPFLTFHYAYTEITASVDRAQVRRRTTRFEDGRLSSEAFEGTLERGAYDALVRDLQRAVLEQQAAFLRMFTPFLPFARARNRDEE